MKTSAAQREILLMTNTSFAQKQWYEKVEDKDLTPQEQMEEACADGLMRELLPEVFDVPDNKTLYLWQMKPGFSYVQLEIGEFPLASEKEVSIDPHNFLSAIGYS